jgi:hypothetical protein
MSLPYLPTLLRIWQDRGPTRSYFLTTFVVKLRSKMQP